MWLIRFCDSGLYNRDAGLEVTVANATRYSSLDAAMNFADETLFGPYEFVHDETTELVVGCDTTRG